MNEARFPGEPTLLAEELLAPARSPVEPVSSRRTPVRRVGPARASEPDPPSRHYVQALEHDLGLLEETRQRDFAAGFLLIGVGVAAALGVAGGFLAPGTGILHPLNAPHVWLPFAAGVWFLRRCRGNDEARNRVHVRLLEDAREQERLALLSGCSDERLLARVLLALAGSDVDAANDPVEPAVVEISDRV